MNRIINFLVCKIMKKSEYVWHMQNMKKSFIREFMNIYE